MLRGIRQLAIAALAASFCVAVSSPHALAQDGQEQEEHPWVKIAQQEMQRRMDEARKNAPPLGPKYWLVYQVTPRHLERLIERLRLNDDGRTIALDLYRLHVESTREVSAKLTNAYQELVMPWGKGPDGKPLATYPGEFLPADYTSQRQLFHKQEHAPAVEQFLADLMKLLDDVTSLATETVDGGALLAARERFIIDVLLNNIEAQPHRDLGSRICLLDVLESVSESQPEIARIVAGSDELRELVTAYRAELAAMSVERARSWPEIRSLEIRSDSGDGPAADALKRRVLGMFDRYWSLNERTALQIAQVIESGSPEGREAEWRSVFTAAVDRANFPAAYRKDAAELVAEWLLERPGMEAPEVRAQIAAIVEAHRRDSGPLVEEQRLLALQLRRITAAGNLASVGVQDETRESLGRVDSARRAAMRRTVSRLRHWVVDSDRAPFEAFANKALLDDSGYRWGGASTESIEITLRTPPTAETQTANGGSK